MSNYSWNNQMFVILAGKRLIGLFHYQMTDYNWLIVAAIIKNQRQHQRSASF